MKQGGRRTQLIWLHPAAPLKPAAGQRCNGCGVCCAAEPCPQARLFLWQRHGACRALEWQTDRQHYRCGLVMHPQRYLRWLPERLAARFGAYVKRRIAADSACDSDVQIEIQDQTAEPGRAPQEPHA